MRGGSTRAVCDRLAVLGADAYCSPWFCAAFSAADGGVNILASDCDAVGKGAVLGPSLSCEGRRQEEGGTGVWPRASDADRCGRLALGIAGDDYWSAFNHMCKGRLTLMMGLSSR